METTEIIQKITEIVTENTQIEALQPFSGSACNVSVEVLQVGLVSLFVIATQDSQTSGNLLFKFSLPASEIWGDATLCSVLPAEIAWRNLVKLHDLVSTSVPKPLCLSAEQNTVVMSEAEGWKSLQLELQEGKVDLVASQRLAELVGKLHNATHAQNLAQEKFEELRKNFRNEAAEDIVNRRLFTEPWDEEEWSQLECAALKKVAMSMHENRDLQNTRDHFLEIYRQKKDCLIQGALTPVSIAVREAESRILETSFVEVGPASFDVGLLLAHYIITYHQHMLTPENNDWHRRVSYKILGVAKDTVSNYLDQMSEAVRNQTSYVDDLMSETAGFCGLELINCGLSTATSCGQTLKDSTKLEVLNSGIRLLKMYHRIYTVDRLLNIALMLTF